MSNYAQWPSSLPAPHVMEGNDQTMGENVIRTQMDVGPPKLRMRSSAAGDKRGFVVKLHGDEQKRTFDQFFKQTLGWGSLPFEWRNYDEATDSGLTGFGSCLSLSGGGYVRIPDSNNYIFETSFTLEFMFKPDSLTAEQGIASKSYGSGQHEWAVYKPEGAAEQLTFRAYDVLAGSSVIQAIEVPLPDTEWHRWTWTVDAAIGSKIYIDGALVDSAATLTSGDNAMEDGTAPVTIGLAEDGAGNIYFANGLIDDVRLWNYDRIAGELTDWDEELVGDEGGLVGYWNFNEMSGITALDLTVSVNHGMIINGAYLPRAVIYQFEEQPNVVPESHQDWKVTMRLEELPQ